MKKTEVVEGVCFGYFNSKEFEECLVCKFSKECEKASSSEEVEELRKTPKNSEKVLSELIKHWREKV